jgi:manganese/iron transport system permease protein
MNLFEPFTIPYMQRALAEVLVLGALAGAVGVLVVLRRLAFVGDALTHTVFPGVVIAHLLGRSLMAGALAFGVLTAVLLTGLGSHRRVGDDAALAILLTSFFSLGVVLISRTRGFTADLTVFLFGRVLAIDRTDLVQTLGRRGGRARPAVLHKELVLRAFDPEAAAAMGYRTRRLDLVLNLLIALVVVAAVEAVGTVLVIALIVVPAAAARLLADRVAAMTALACLLGAAGGWLGLAISYEVSVDHDLRLAAGATIVVVLVGLFLVAAAVAPLRRRLARDRVPAVALLACSRCSGTPSRAGPCSRRSWSGGCAAPSGCTCCCGACPSSPWPSATPPSPGSSWPRSWGSACSPGRPPSGPWWWSWSPCSGPATGSTTPAPSG